MMTFLILLMGVPGFCSIMSERMAEVGDDSSF